VIGFNTVIKLRASVTKFSCSKKYQYTLNHTDAEQISTACANV